jgi:hypothetical protein
MIYTPQDFKIGEKISIFFYGNKYTGSYILCEIIVITQKGIQVKGEFPNNKLGIYYLKFKNQNYNFIIEKN